MTAQAAPQPVPDELQRRIVRDKLANPLHQATTITYWIGEQDDRLLVTVRRSQATAHWFPLATVEDRSGVIARVGPCSIDTLLDKLSAILTERIWGSGK